MTQALLLLAQAADGVGSTVLFGALAATAGAFVALVYWVLNKLQSSITEKLLEILTAIRALTAQMDIVNQLRLVQVFKDATTDELLGAKAVIKQRLADARAIDPGK